MQYNYDDKKHDKSNARLLLPPPYLVQDIFLNKHHIYVIYVNMQHDFVDMQHNYYITYNKIMLACKIIQFACKHSYLTC